MPEVCCAGSGPQLPFRFRSGPFHRAAITGRLRSAPSLHRSQADQCCRGVVSPTVFFKGNVGEQCLSRHSFCLDHTSRARAAFRHHLKATCFCRAHRGAFWIEGVFLCHLRQRARWYPLDKGDLIAHVLKAESLSPHSTVMVGDRAHDIVGAKAHGVFPIGVLWGYGSYDELIAAGATTLCEQPEMLDKILLSNSKLNPRSPRERESLRTSQFHRREK